MSEDYLSLRVTGREIDLQFKKANMYILVPWQVREAPDKSFHFSLLLFLLSLAFCWLKSM
jgi:hypothetical protein